MSGGQSQVMDIVLTGLDVSKVVVANGSEAITIDAKGPTAVGTATISKWLRVRDQGVDYYIPMWT